MTYTCDIEINLCYSNPCLNGATCKQVEAGYRCLCPTGFKGNSSQNVCEARLMCSSFRAMSAFCWAGSICIGRRLVPHDRTILLKYKKLVDQWLSSWICAAIRVLKIDFSELRARIDCVPKKLLSVYSIFFTKMTTAHMYMLDK